MSGSIVCSEDTKHAFLAAHTEWSIATDIYRDIIPPRTAEERQKGYAERLQRITARDMQVWRDKCRAEFGAARGWHLKQCTYATECAIRRAGLVGSLDYPVLDHTDIWYRGRKFAALTTHAYAFTEQIQEYADSHGLICEFLDFSWYRPGTPAAVLTPKVRP